MHYIMIVPLGIQRKNEWWLKNSAEWSESEVTLDPAFNVTKIVTFFGDGESEDILEVTNTLGSLTGTQVAILEAAITAFRQGQSQAA